MTDCPHGEPHPSVCAECLDGPPPPAAREPGVAECSACHARIIWTVTAKGKLMPVDAEPGFAGKFVMTGDQVTTDKGTAPRVEWDGKNERRQPHYVAHWSTCPNAGQFKR